MEIKRINKFIWRQWKPSESEATRWCPSKLLWWMNVVNIYIKILVCWVEEWRKKRFLLSIHNGGYFLEMFKEFLKIYCLLKVQFNWINKSQHRWGIQIRQMDSEDLILQSISLLKNQNSIDCTEFISFLRRNIIKNVILRLR